MYALPRGPSKIVASTRRGPTRGFDVSENCRDQAEKGCTGATMNAVQTKAFFTHNGKMRGQPRTNHVEHRSPHHQDAVRFLEDTWNKAIRDYNRDKNSSNPKDGGAEWYRQRESNPTMDDFKKFDLEEYWGNRTMRRLTESS
ncbi:mapk-regulated corepressor-interacting protein 1-like [Littorina saxatilis]|uniref:Uncharacterized protein n=1 Tax=Littorina saxatilis TaxID=31220 RepID=A0AAN9BXC6_9CAEN